MRAAYCRGEILQKTPVCFAVTAALLSAAAREAFSQQKVTKAMVQYQATPKGGHQCAGCSTSYACAADDRGTFPSSAGIKSTPLTIHHARPYNPPHSINRGSSAGSALTSQPKIPPMITV